MEATSRDTGARQVDVGTGFGRPPSTYIKSLTEVGRGTPMGELLRRYWHPVGLAAHATATPREVRVLGEDLILFRDGRPAGAGACALRASRHHALLRQGRGARHPLLLSRLAVRRRRPLPGAALRAGGRPRCATACASPGIRCEERYGLMFAYMGPPEKKPVLPRYECLESLDEGEFVEADDTSIGSGGPQIVPCNWLQHFENVVDPYHVPILHGTLQRRRSSPR